MTPREEVQGLFADEAHKKAVMGAMAVLLGRGLRMWGAESAEWAKTFLADCASAIGYRGPLETYSALCVPPQPLDEPIDPTAFVSVVPAALRAPMAVGLMVASATAHGYDARARVAFKGLCLAMGVSAEAFLAAEDEFARRVATAGVSGAPASDADAPAAASAAESLSWRKAIAIGGLAAIGGTLIAATAGLAAPAVGVGLAAVGGLGGATGAALVAPLAGFLGTASGGIVFTTLFGATGAGLSGYKARRRLGGVREFRFERLDGEEEEGAPAEPPAAEDVAPASEPPSGVARDGTGPGQRRPLSASASAAFARAGRLGLRAPAMPWQTRERAAAPAHARAGAQPAAAEHARLTVRIFVSGWCAHDEDTPAAQWRHRAAAAEAQPGEAAAAEAALPPACDVLGTHAEPWVLVWEQAELLALGTALKSFVTSEITGRAVTEALMHTTLSALMSALALPSLLIKATNLIDNPWSVALERARKVGEMLADVLLERVHGARPVSLVGYSLGARVILSCVEVLARAGKRGLGLVEDVVVLGAPVQLHARAWADARTVAAGRVVNAFCGSDWVLGTVYRANAHGAVSGIGGISPVPCAGVENVDVSDLVGGHLKYSTSLSAVLARIASSMPSDAQAAASSAPSSRQVAVRGGAAQRRGAAGGATALPLVLRSVCYEAMPPVGAPAAAVEPSSSTV